MLQKALQWQGAAYGRHCHPRRSAKQIPDIEKGRSGRLITTPAWYGRQPPRASDECTILRLPTEREETQNPGTRPSLQGTVVLVTPGQRGRWKMSTVMSCDYSFPFQRGKEGARMCARVEGSAWACHGEPGARHLSATRTENEPNATFRSI